jgi:hypothetical protein
MVIIAIVLIWSRSLIVVISVSPINVRWTAEELHLAIDLTAIVNIACVAFLGLECVVDLTASNQNVSDSRVPVSRSCVGANP